MDELDKRNRAIALFTMYGGLLSKTQRQALNSHLCYDLSISEIAESARISRAAASDAITKGMEKLQKIEDSLGLLGKQQEYASAIAAIELVDDDKAKLSLYRALGRLFTHGI